MNLTLKRICTAAAAAMLTGFFLMPDLSAQGSLPNMFSQRKGKKRTDKPTKITALTMDIDILHNIATLLGNVIVDDQEIKITCNKMIIYLEDKEEDPAAAKQQAKTNKKEDEDDPTGGKQLNKIECIGDVVITRVAAADEAPDSAQSATAGKAIYDMKENTITLLEKPVLISGKDRIEGSRIVVLVGEGGRMRITKGSVDYHQADNKLALPGLN